MQLTPVASQVRGPIEAEHDDNDRHLRKYLDEMTKMTKEPLKGSLPAELEALHDYRVKLRDNGMHQSVH